jgi:hypothetical protein
VAKLVARLQATAAIWIDSRHLLKIQNGNISTGVANKLKTSKKYKNKKEQNIRLRTLKQLLEIENIL